MKPIVFLAASLLAAVGAYISEGFLALWFAIASIVFGIIAIGEYTDLLNRKRR